jgi:shikimate kinase
MTHRPTDQAAVKLRHVVLVGLMGTGKTTTGVLVAAALGMPFRDGDAMLEAALGRTAAALRDEEGVEALHRAEARFLREALAADRPSVIAASAAVVDNPACRAALRTPGVAVAWLRANPAVLGRRFSGDAAASVAAGLEGTHRPAYGEDPGAFLAAQARRRARRFAACRPRVIVDTGLLDPAAAAERIIAALGGASGGAGRGQRLQASGPGGARSSARGYGRASRTGYQPHD